MFSTMSSFYGKRLILATCVFLFGPTVYADLVLDEGAFRSHSAAVVGGPRSLGLTGVLLDGSGVPFNGAATLTVSRWDAPSGGTQLGSDTFAVAVSNGRFSVNTADTPATFGAFLDSAMPNFEFLSFTVNGSDVGRVGFNRSLDNLSSPSWTLQKLTTALTLPANSPGVPNDSGPGVRSLAIGGRVDPALSEIGSVTVRVYDGPVGGTEQSSTTISNVTVARGQFIVDPSEQNIGIGDVLNSLNDPYVTVQFDGGNESQRLRVNDVGVDVPTDTISATEVQVLSAFRGPNEPQPDSGRTWNISGIISDEFGTPRQGLSDVSVEIFSEGTGSTVLVSFSALDVPFSDGAFSLNPIDFAIMDFGSIPSSSLSAELAIDGVLIPQRLPVNLPFQTFGTIASIPEAGGFLYGALVSTIGVLFGMRRKSTCQSC